MGLAVGSPKLVTIVEFGFTSSGGLSFSLLDAMTEFPDRTSTTTLRLSGDGFLTITKNACLPGSVAQRQGIK